MNETQLKISIDTNTIPTNAGKVQRVHGNIPRLHVFSMDAFLFWIRQKIPEAPVENVDISISGPMPNWAALQIGAMLKGRCKTLTYETAAGFTYPIEMGDFE